MNKEELLLEKIIELFNNGYPRDAFKYINFSQPCVTLSNDFKITKSIRYGVDIIDAIWRLKKYEPHLDAIVNAKSMEFIIKYILQHPSYILSQILADIQSYIHSTNRHRIDSTIREIIKLVYG